LAIAAAYAHPVEYITCNMWSVSVGPLLLGSHPLVLWAWTIYLNYRTILLHSDYALPGFQKPNFHDFHHIRFNQNFGSCGAMDRIYETDIVFQKMTTGKEKST
jgi:sterol desaturase/sphingolipid hydroxylase (fatty acid hydroxylase superfamily)